MSLDIHRNSYVTWELRDKLINYPEHKLKNETAIVARETKENVNLYNDWNNYLNKSNDWWKDQFDFNFNRTHHKNRTLSKEELEQKLKNKKIATTYTLSENALFFKQKFNNDKEKIIEFYQLALNSFLEEASIPKSQLINAIIHFDQTTPHLHFAISNIYPKYSKSLNREILTVNYQKHELIRSIFKNKKSNEISWNQWIELKEQKRKYYRKEISKSDWEAYRRNNYEAGFLYEIEQKINQKYYQINKEMIYKDKEDRIFVETIRGFTNSDIEQIIFNRTQDKDYLRMEKNIILKSRETSIETGIKNLRYRKNVDEKEIDKLHKEYVNAFRSNDIESEIYYRNKLIDKLCNAQYGNFIKEYRNKISFEERNYFNNFLENHAEMHGFIDDDYFTAYSIIDEPKKLIAIKFIADNSTNYITTLHELFKPNITRSEILDLKEKYLIEIRAIEALISSLVENYNPVSQQINWNTNENIDINQWKQEREKWIKNAKYQLNLLNEMKHISKFNIFKQIDSKNWSFKKEMFLINEKYKLLQEQARNQMKMDIDLNKSNYEQHLMFKKVHRERVDYDLKILNFYKKDKSFGKNGEFLNGIERNRVYNQILEYCAFKSKEREKHVHWAKETLQKYNQQMKNENISYQKLTKSTISDDYSEFGNKAKFEIESAFKILKRGIKYTPQTLAKEMYANEFVPINYQREYDLIQEKNINSREKEQAIEDLKYTKKLELFIVTQKTGEELNKEFEKHKGLNIWEEHQVYTKHLEKHKEEIIENTKELIHDAKLISNWLTHNKYLEDIQIYNQLNENKTFEEKMDIEECYHLDVVQEYIKENFDELEKELNYEYQPFGLDMDLVSDIATDGYIKENNLEITYNFEQVYGIVQEMEQEFYKYNSLFIQSNEKPELDFDDIRINNNFESELHINEINYKSIQNIITTLDEEQREREIELLLNLAHEGYDIRNKAKELNINAFAIQKTIEESKQKGMSKSQEKIKVKELEEEMSIRR